MKKLTFTFAIIIISMFISNAQEVGIRLGNVTGGDAAVDVIFSTGKYHRLHGDVSFGYGLGVDLLWDFLYRPLGDDGVNWYVGAGPYTFLGEPLHLGAVGEIGLEYTFSEIPICLGADWRPNFRLLEETELGTGGFGVNIRWVF